MQFAVEPPPFDAMREAWLTDPFVKWDNPTMSTTRLDSKKRLVLPNGRPGEVFDIQQQAEGRFLLVRLEKPPARRISKKACLAAMRKAPLRLTMTWEELRKQTREP